MQSDPADSFRAERPIGSRTEDLLGRGHFAEALARSVVGWHANESLVVGLHGPWGSGKSSIKNMMLETIAEIRPRIRVLEFNPWHFANSRQLLESFFRDLTKTIGASLFRTEEDRRIAIKRLEKYRAYLRLGKTVGAGVRVAGIALLALPLVQSTLSSFEPRYGWILSVASALTGLLFLLSPRLWEALLGTLTAREDARAQTLEDSKKDIADALRELDAPLLVVIDDVDRLDRDEIRAVFQLVKVNADFPKLIYLLLFDREAVESAIGGTSPSSGRDFVEKIVQVAFTVPVIEAVQLETALLNGLDSIVARGYNSAIADDTRFGLLFIYLRTYLYSLRRVYRFLSSFSLHLSLFTHGGQVSVNLADFIALEVLRLYEPDLYDAIARSKDRLFGTDFDITEADNKDRLAALLASVPEPRRPRARSILEELFPTASGGATYNEKHAGEWRRTLRICADDVFDRYFQFRLGQEDLSGSAIRSLLESSRTGEAFDLKLRELAGRGQLAAAIRALEAQKDELPTGQAAEIVATLFTVSDLFPRVSTLSLSVGPDQFAAEIIRTLLRRLQIAHRDEVILESSRRTTGIYLPLVLADEALGGESAERPLVSQEAASQLLIDSLARLEATASTDLVNHPHLGVLLGIWQRRGSIDSLRKSATALAQTQKGAISLLRALSSRSQGSSGRGRGIRSEYRIHFNDLNEIVSSAVITRALETTDPHTLNFEDKLLLEAFREDPLKFPAGSSS